MPDRADLPITESTSNRPSRWWPTCAAWGWVPSSVVGQDVGGGGGLGGWVCDVVVGFGFWYVTCRLGDGDVLRRVVVVGRAVRGDVDVVVGSVVVVVVGGAIDGPWNVAAVIAGASAPARRLPTSQNVAPIRATAMTPMATGFARDGVGARCRPAMPCVILRSEFGRWNVVFLRPITARAGLDYESATAVSRWCDLDHERWS